MSDFYHNLSKQALSKPNDAAALKFVNISRLKKNINSLLHKHFGIQNGRKN